LAVAVVIRQILMGSVLLLVFLLLDSIRVRRFSTAFHPIGRIAAPVEISVVRLQIMLVVMVFVARQAKTVAMVFAPIPVQIQIAVDVGSLAIAALTRASGSVAMKIKAVATVFVIQPVTLVPMFITVGAATLFAQAERVVVMASVQRLLQMPIVENAAMNAKTEKIVLRAVACVRTVNHR
jgi:hypothetical protein